ncbi:hypothetical protein Lalb_Chr09g0325301 [Lupinus albus]|uniref:Uncharacterized protein n=1 Tax=Lupinus albus TaxID=3870 RepID=A0A6A4Q0E8_LUPAL|nr:hypothetical protein Lalb_Chr09g0325301 [Lupinus albus]
MTHYRKRMLYSFYIVWFLLSLYSKHSLLKERVSPRNKAKNKKKTSGGLNLK